MSSDLWTELMGDSALPLESFETQNDSREEEILNAIIDRVRMLFDSNPELLFSSMYRMDVSELKVRRAMMDYTGDALLREIAILIWERQKMRLWTKKNIVVKPIDWSDL